VNKEEINKVSVNDKKGFSQALLYRLLPSLLVFILALLAFNNGVHLEIKHLKQLVIERIELKLN